MIPLFDPRPLHARLGPELDAAIARVVASGRFVLGPEVEAFEREFAARLGIRAAVGVGSGTDALILALRAVGVGSGDEVITVGNAGFPTVAAIRAIGARAVLVDVDARTLLLDPARLEAARTPATRAIVPVHLYGQCADMAAIGAFADLHALAVVEDAAQAHGATCGGRPAGTFGRIGCFSFYPTKNLGALGDGGAAVTGDPALEERLRRLRTYGWLDDRAHPGLEGVNSRLDELQAAVLRVKLAHLDDALAERRALAERYTAALGGSERSDGSARSNPFLPVEAPGRRHAWHLYVVRPRDRARATAALDRAGIGWGVHYPTAVHENPAYAAGVRVAGDLRVTERACRTVLSLPLWPGLGAEQADAVAGALAGAE